MMKAIFRTETAMSSDFGRSSFRKALCLSLPCVVVLLTTSVTLPADAKTYFWKGGTGNYQDKKKWNPDDVPQKDDSIKIEAPNSVVNVTNDFNNESFHNLTLGAGNTINVNAIGLSAFGNSLTNHGTINLSGSGTIFSFSKNLIIGGTGVINSQQGAMIGNMTIDTGQTFRGSGFLGYDSDRLFNNGIIQADRNGEQVYFYNAINGTGTFRSQNGGKLHFSADSSGDYLINNGVVQIESGNFYVGRDYQGGFFRSGNSFDARRTVQGPGGIFAADARQVVSGPRLSGGVIDFGALRVGDRVTTSLAVSNTGTLTILRGAVQNSGAPDVLVTQADFVLAPSSAAHTTQMTFVGKTAGATSNEKLDVVNNFDNVADDHFSIAARVYAPAVVGSQSNVDFGIVRKGTPGVSGSLTFGNFATGALSDRLVPSYGATPPSVSLTAAPASVQAGKVATAVYALDTGTAGAVAGSTTIGFTSSNAEMADLSLGSRTIRFVGTVTDPAVAELTKQSGTGLLTRRGDEYTLDLGTLSQTSGAFSTELGVLNAVSASTFAETLGGSFTLTGDSGFSFIGDSFSGLAAGASDVANWLRFDPNGLSDGTHRATLTFNGFSHYAGLDDQGLEPIELSVSAVVTSVPEPTTWLLMVAGLGFVGATRRTRVCRHGSLPRRGVTPDHCSRGIGRWAWVAVAAAIVPLAGCMTTPKQLVDVYAAFPNDAVAMTGTEIPGESTKSATYDVAFSDIFRLANLSASQAQLNVEDVQQRSGLIYATRSVMFPVIDGRTIPSRYYYLIRVEEVPAKRTRVQIAAKFQAQCEKFTTGARVFFGATTLGLSEAMIPFLEKKGQTCDDLSSPTWAKLSYSAEPEMAQFLTLLRNNLLAARLI